MLALLLLPFLMLLGLLEMAGTLVMYFGAGIFVLMAVLTVFPLGPDHATNWSKLALPGAIAAGAWLVRRTSLWIQWALQRRGLARPRFAPRSTVPGPDWNEIARLRRAAGPTRPSGDAGARPSPPQGR